MQSSPEANELANIFKQLDSQNNGYLTQQQFSAYLDKQPRKISLYLINDLFSALPGSKMNEQAFVCFVQGYRLNCEAVAIARLNLETKLAKHISASPSSGANEIRKSSLKFSVASKNNAIVGDKHSLSISLGRDQNSQSEKYQELEGMLGRKPEEIVGVIKFRVDGAHEQIRQGFETLIQSVKGIASDMDEQLSAIINMFKFNVKANGNDIYIIVEVSEPFLVNCSTFLNQLVQSISPDCLFHLSASIESNYLQNFLKDGGEKKMEDLQIKFGLDIDNESLKKIKEVIMENNLQKENELVALLLLLIQQVNMSASFVNSQKLFNKLGINEGFSGAKMQLGAIKEMAILETMQGFVPESASLIENLKKHGKGQGEISINAKNIFLCLEFNVHVDGFFDLF